MTIPAASQQGISKAGIVFFSSLCASTFALGCWQTERYLEKIDLQAQRETELAMEPIIVSSTSRLDSKNNARQEKECFRRIKINGTFRHENELLVGPRGPPPGALAFSGPNSGRSGGGMSSSPQGYFVLTPFESSNGGGIVLVNRGWVPRHFVIQQPNQRILDTNWERPQGEISIVGVESKPERK